MASPNEFAPADSFKNRTVIVTGGAGSIGRPLCLAFASAGANVVVNDLGGDISGSGSSPSPASDVVAEIKLAGGSAVADTHSVADAAAILSTALETFGRIDIIVNNAGITRFGPLEAQPPENFTDVFAVNAAAPLALLHHAWPHFQAQSYGRVINFASDSIFGMANSLPYVLARGATFGATRTLALEGAPHGILVNAVCPTSYSRMMAPMFKDLPPEHQAATEKNYRGEANVPMILALAHEACAVSGQVFSTGGYGMSRVMLGATSAVGNCRTMGEVQRRLPELLEKEREFVEPMNVYEFASFRTRTLQS
ncbi:NAD(P)-binding protein [Mytilinidion resinicola]|uniref:NAD(P)-binding protein n=1 Tax=Mytilinidion resinicola TaxID=574789 RepID=A0A6A6Y9C6_9PEZI|nr:NAD(P)-binding protein [Mytilinidion resinicola]KAF2805239.1 NAD(P)-binding protein [Mytilinidion resinicola]